MPFEIILCRFAKTQFNGLERLPVTQEAAGSRLVAAAAAPRAVFPPQPARTDICRRQACSPLPSDSTRNPKPATQGRADGVMQPGADVLTSAVRRHRVDTEKLQQAVAEELAAKLAQPRKNKPTVRSKKSAQIASFFWEGGMQECIPPFFWGPVGSCDIKPTPRRPR